MDVDTRHSVKGVGGRLLHGLVLRGVIGCGLVVVHSAVQQEEALAYFVVAARVLIVAVEAEAKTASFVLLRRR